MPLRGRTVKLANILTNFCGLGGAGIPINEIDTICKQHDEDYGKIMKNAGSGGYKRAYFQYNWADNNMAIRLAKLVPKSTSEKIVKKIATWFLHHKKNFYQNALKGVYDDYTITEDDNGLVQMSDKQIENKRKHDEETNNNKRLRTTETSQKVIEDKVVTPTNSPKETRYVNTGKDNPYNTVYDEKTKKYTQDVNVKDSPFWGVGGNRTERKESNIPYDENWKPMEIEIAGHSSQTGISLFNLLWITLINL